MFMISTNVCLNHLNSILFSFMSCITGYFFFFMFLFECQSNFVYNFIFLLSVAALVAWAWLVSCPTVSPAWCSVALQHLLPEPPVNLAGVFRMSPAYQCQVRPKEEGRRAEGKKLCWELTWEGKDFCVT